MTDGSVELLRSHCPNLHYLFISCTPATPAVANSCTSTRGTNLAAGKAVGFLQSTEVADVESMYKPIYMQHLRLEFSSPWLHNGRSVLTAARWLRWLSLPPQT